MSVNSRILRFFVLFVALAVTASLAFANGQKESKGTQSAASTSGKYVIGVSNTLTGNGWREEMICSIKAQALVSHQVSRLILSNRTEGPQGQIQDLRNLIADGVNAIILDPSNYTALDSVLNQAMSRGIVVVAVDQPVAAKGAYIVDNNQTMYGYLGAKWLFQQLHGKGNVVEMQGADGAPANTQRENGFKKALTGYPNIHIVANTYTNWTEATASEQIRDILSSGTKVDGVWTSGVDSTIVDVFKAENKPYVPVVGADNEGFIKQLLTMKSNGLTGVAVTNPPVVGGAGLTVALDALSGKSVSHHVQLTPGVWPNTTSKGVGDLKAHDLPTMGPYYSTDWSIPHYTTYSESQLLACKGP